MENAFAIFDLVRPVSYDKPSNLPPQELVYSNGLPVERLEKVPSLKELKTKAKECGLKGYYKMRKSELLKLLNKA